jgi:microcystin-dependent protein
MSSLSRGTKEEAFSILPAGTVLPFAGATAPSGWAICDGSIVSRSEYPELFLAIGEAWGNGDGSTTFHLPDMRGRFMRGADNGTGRDPDAGSRTASNAGGATGDNVGTVQSHNFGSHNHGGGAHTHRTNDWAGRIAGYASAIASNRISTGTNGLTNNTGGNSIVANTGGRSANISSEGGNENRPVNANMNYIIKL